jgi:hypothetical protein
VEKWAAITTCFERAQGRLKINYFMDSWPTLDANPSSLGVPYRRFALSSARNIGPMMRSPARSSTKYDPPSFECQDIN